MKITFTRTVHQKDYLAELEAKHGSLDSLRRKARRKRSLVPLVDEWAHLVSHPERSDEEIQQSHTFIFHDAEMFFKAISPARLRVYEFLRAHPDVASVNELARRLGRNYRNVYEDVHHLAGFGVVDLERSGNRTIPHVRVHAVEVAF